MPGFKIITDMDPELAIKAVSRVAKRLGFSVYRVEDWELVVQRGNLALSILLGAFIAYCYFPVRFEEDRRGNLRIVMERNTPWWTGFIGISRVKSWAKSLADGVEDEIEARGARILNSEEF
jgi:hypothetical protein